jgi:hypothetical protein
LQLGSRYSDAPLLAGTLGHSKAAAFFALRFALLLSLLSASAAAEHWDHRGSLGLLVGGAGQYRLGLGSSGVWQAAPLAGLDLGATLAIGVDGNEIKLLGRVAFGSGMEGMLAFGYRGYFGQEALKTFFDIDLALHRSDAFTLGPKLGVGLQYEVHPLVGVFGALAASFGFGQAIRFTGEVCVGVQIRSYLLE